MFKQISLIRVNPVYFPLLISNLFYPLMVKFKKTIKIIIAVIWFFLFLSSERIDYTNAFIINFIYLIDLNSIIRLIEFTITTSSTMVASTTVKTITTGAYVTAATYITAVAAVTTTSTGSGETTVVAATTNTTAGVKLITTTKNFT